MFSALPRKASSIWVPTEFLQHDPDPVNAVQSAQSYDTTELLAQQIDLLEASLGKEFVNRVFFLYPELLK